MLLLNKSHKVLLIYQTPDNGGTRTFFIQLTQFLLDKGFIIHLIAKKSEFTGIIPDYCNRNNISIHLFNEEVKSQILHKWKLNFICIKYLASNIMQVLFLYKIFIKVKPNFTIISQGWPFFWFKALFLPGKKFFIQHVMPLHPLDSGHKAILKLALTFNQGTFITVSNFAKRKMQEFWIENYPKIHTLYNYAPHPDSINKIAKNDNSIVILCMARVEEGKNPLLWIKIAKEIIKDNANVSFIWAGKGSLLSEARDACKDTPNIQFIGFADKTHELYNKADIYFEPSKRDAHGISIVEAMSYKLPSIGTANGGPSESILDGTSGFVVNVEDRNEMVQKLSLLIKNKQLRKQMGNNAYNRYCSMFTKPIWEETLSSILPYF